MLELLLISGLTTSVTGLGANPEYYSKKIIAPCKA
jgi:hypothetical protein